MNQCVRRNEEYQHLYNAMDISIFPDKANKPTDNDLVNCLGATYELWVKLRDIVFEMYPMAKEEWNFPGKKYGWSFRIILKWPLFSDKKPQWKF